MTVEGATRRAVLRATGGAVVGEPLLDGLHRPTRVQSDETWPRFGYDDANTGNAPQNTGPVADISQHWSFQADGKVRRSPAVADGTVYVGSDDGHVYALDADDGTEQWSFNTGAKVFAPPTVADGTVYVGSNDERVYALDAKDGTKQWSFQTGAWVFSSPVVTDDTVYTGSNDTNVYALDAGDGTEQWSFETGGRVRSSPAVADGTVYVGSDGTQVYALNASDGTEQWSFQAGDAVGSAPAISDGTVYVGSKDTNVYALDTDDGTEQWSFQTGAAVATSPAVVDDSVYLGSNDGHVYALDADDGTEQWAYQTGSKVRSSPAVVDNTVYIGSNDANLYALDASDGTEQWIFQKTGANVNSSPAVVDGTVFVGSHDTNLYALTGKTNRGTTSPPTIRTDTIDTVHTTAESQDDRPILPLIVAALGIGGVGVWWFTRRTGSDTIFGGGKAGGTLAGDSASGSGGQNGEEFPANPDDVLADAEGLLATASGAREAGDYDQALEALDAAIAHFEHLETTTADLDADIDVDNRLTTLRQRRREMGAERATVTEIQERLATAEERLSTADQAYDNDDEVVARLRYRQARDIYADVIDRLQEADLEDVTVTAGGHQFEGLADIEARQQAAADGFELTD